MAIAIWVLPLLQQSFLVKAIAVILYQNSQMIWSTQHPHIAFLHTGMAVDIVSASYQKLTRQQEKTAEQKWLMEHCWEYGFILRYPTDKSEVTGIGYEPWHYRYVGRETALAMRDSGLCLEEYLVVRRMAEAIGVHTETIQETVEAVS